MGAFLWPPEYSKIIEEVAKVKTNNVSFQSAIRKINTLVDTGVIETYALGGATAASFYTEPILTEDVDLFMPLKPRPGEMLVSISNILDFKFEK